MEALITTGIVVEAYRCNKDKRNRYRITVFRKMKVANSAVGGGLEFLGGCGVVMLNRMAVHMQSLTQENEYKHEQQEGCSKLSYWYGFDFVQQGECSTSPQICNEVA